VSQKLEIKLFFFVQGNFLVDHCAWMKQNVRAATQEKITTLDKPLVKVVNEGIVLRFLITRVAFAPHLLWIYVVFNRFHPKISEQNKT